MENFMYAFLILGGCVALVWITTLLLTKKTYSKARVIKVDK